MKIKLWIFTILFLQLITVSYSQDVEVKTEPRTIEQVKKLLKENKTKADVKYDEFKDLTQVSLKPMIVSMGLPALTKITLVIYFKGKGFDEVKDIVFAVNSRAKEYQYLHTSNLIFLADEERVNIGGSTRTIDVQRDYVYETLIYFLSKEQLITISNADSVRFQIASGQGKLNSKEIARIKFLTELIESKN